MKGEMIKIFNGITTLVEINEKIFYYMTHIRGRGSMSVDIQKREDGYHAKIYVTRWEQ